MRQYRDEFAIRESPYVDLTHDMQQLIALSCYLVNERFHGAPRSLNIMHLREGCNVIGSMIPCNDIDIDTEGTVTTISM